MRTLASIPKTLALLAALHVWGCNRAETPTGPTGPSLNCPEGTHEVDGVCVSLGWGVDGGVDAGDPSRDGGASCEEIIESTVGAACETRCDCGADERWTCRVLHPGGGAIPGGYCVFDCAMSPDDCPAGSVCFETVGNVCYDACKSSDECRTDEGYDCIDAAGAFICWHP